ncbi:MAG: peptidoglycan editing factor PgeF [Firmicutes bacterium]|nr:peptidoglycan editing factor PgeF [Bacillota bacterium]
MPLHTQASPDYSLTLEYKQGVGYYVSRPLLERHGILAVFTTRQGGFSRGAYGSLNLALHVGDDSELVIRNREKLCSIFGLDMARLVCAEQVHGTDTALIDESRVGLGAFSLEDSIKGTDALVTASKLVPLILFFADCVPVIIVEPWKRSVAVIHAGWRGIYGDIIGKTIGSMFPERGDASESALAFVGPAIGGCCYTVGRDLIQLFTERFESSQEWLDGDRIDLRAIARGQLLKSGILNSNIYTCEDCCTACNSGLFFSYRADSGTTGRQAALAAILT